MSALNDLDLDTIRDKYLTSRIDDRSPVVKALDLVDLPRNVVANILFRPAGLETGKLRKGAFGLPSISFSDALGELGVKPGLVRGIAGFVGDVALDPLTYLGPAGWGLEAVGNTGRVVRVAKGGKNLLKGGIKEFGTSGSASNPLIRGIYDQLLSVAPDAIKNGDNAAKTAYLSKKTLGDVTGGNVAKRSAKWIGERAGMDRRTSGSVLADSLDEISPLGDAVRAFMAKNGAAASRGYSLGGRGSQIAHIPLTDIALHTKPFTRAGEAAASDLALATSGSARSIDDILRDSGATAAAASLVPDIHAAYDTVTKHRKETNAAIEAFDKQIEAGGDARTLADQRDAYAASRQAEFEQLKADLDAKHTKLEELTKHADPAKPLTPLDMAALTQWGREMGVQRDLFNARLASEKHVTDTFRRIQREASEHADDSMEVADRIVEQQTATQKGGPLKSVEVIEGKTPPSNVDEILNEPVPPSEIPPISLFERRKEIRKLTQRINSLPDDHPDIPSLLEDIRILRYRDSLHDVAAGRLSGEGVDRAPEMFLPSDPTGKVLVPQDPVVRQRVFEAARPILDQLDEAEKALVAVKSAPKTVAAEAAPLFTPSSLGEGVVDAATQAREVEHAAALERVLSLRQELLRVTEEARRTPGVPLDAAKESVKQANVANLDTLQRDIAKLNETDIKAAEELADATHAIFTAYGRAHGAARGSMQNYAALSPQETQLVRMAQRFLETDSAIIGRAALTAPAAMLREIGSPELAARFNNKLGTFMAETFGQRGTAISEQLRMVRHMDSVGAWRAANSYLNSVVKDLRASIAKTGFKATPKDLDEINAILFAMSVRNSQARGLVEVGRETMYTTKFGGKKGELTKSLQLIQDAISSGKFGEHTKPLMAELEKVAETYGEGLLKEIREAMIEAGDSASLRAGYIGHSLTPEARSLVRRQKTYGAGLKNNDTAIARASLRAKESSEYGRTLDEVRFVSQRPGMEGVERRLFRTDFDNAKHFILNPQELDALRAEGKDGAAIAKLYDELVADAREYMAMPERPHFRNADPFELNELVNTGRFSLLLDGGSPKGGLMQTNFMAAMADRLMQFKRSEMHAQAAKYLDQFGVTIPSFNVTAGNGQILTQDGAVAQIVDSVSKDGKTSKTVIVGGQRYRPLRNDITGLPDNPMAPFFGEAASKRLYNEEVATAIESLALHFKDGASTYKVIQGLDMLTRQWKNLTLLHPGWWTFNMIGDVWNALSRGANPVHLFNPKLAKFTSQVERAKGDPAKLAKLVFDFNGQKVTGKQYWDWITGTETIDGSLFHETPLAMIENGLMQMPSTAAGLGPMQKMRLSAMTSDAREMIRQRAVAAGREAENASLADKVKGVANVISDRYAESFLAPWWKINQRSSNYLRMQVFGSYLLDGFDPKAAALKTLESQFDYADMTKIESSIFRRMFPFYAWMRNNGAMQMRTLFEHPVYAASFPKFQAMIEEGVNGEGRVPLEQRPNWMRNALALQIGADPEHRTSIMLGGGLPVGDLYQQLAGLMGRQGMMDFLHYFASSLNPVANSLLQLGAGQETFSGRSIGPDSLSGDVTAVEFIKNQIRPIAEYGPGGKVYKAFDKGIGQGVGRVLLGGRVQDFGEERLHSTKLREYKDKETNIRRVISKAEREGDKSRSVAARAKLMQLYDLMAENGFAADTPRWAQRQLQSLNAAR